MYDEHEIIERVMQAFGMWPTAEHIANTSPAEIREILIAAIYAIEGPYLLALLWLSSSLYLRQTQALS